jgi:predicted acetyltransferase
MTMSGAVALESCAANDARLQPLLQEYLREWSTRLAVPVNAHGVFVYERLDSVDRVLILVDSAPVGFAFTTRDDRAQMHVEEFFIAPHARHRGLGVRATHALFACAPRATWTWTVRPENPDGLAFWRRACPSAVTSSEMGGDGIVRTRFTHTP